jgi:hypothetical protein
MKKLLLILALTLAVLSCGQSRNNSEITTRPKKLIDVPQLMGKSPDEVKSFIGREPKKVEGNEQHYAFDELEICGLEFKNGKFNSITLEGSKFTFETPEQLGDFFGIDVRGQTSRDLGSMVYFQDPTINGVKIHHVSFRKRDDGRGYNGLIFEVEH